MLKRTFIVLCVFALLSQGGSRRTAVDPYPFCGKRFLSGNIPDSNLSLSKRIVGGQESIPGSWPWQVALLLNGTQVCGGSLINKQWVVTASHCFCGPRSSTNPKFWTTTLGEHRLKQKDSFEQVRQVERIIVHPMYNYKGSPHDTPPDYDIALVKLDKPVVFDHFVYPICLLQPGTTFPPGKQCHVTGWGHTKFNGTQPPALNEAAVKLVSMKTCNKNVSYAGKIHGRALCAGFEKGGVDACQFDSGGPLSCEKVDQYYLTGIVSWGHGCARPHKYGVYSNMAVMTSWVVETIEKIEASIFSASDYSYIYC